MDQQDHPQELDPTEYSSQTEITQVASPPPRRNESKKNALVAAGLLMMLLAVCTGIFLTKKSDKPAPVSSVPKQSQVITYYYSDGKTVLYRDTDPSQDPSMGPTPAPYFAKEAHLKLKETYGADFYKQGKWEVVTTLDQRLQDSAQKYVDTQEAAIAKQGAMGAAFVAQEVGTGKVVAWVGNATDKFGIENPLGFASSNIEPGSSIKPFVYAALFDKTKNMGAGSQIDDTQGPLAGYPCTVATPVQQSNCLFDYDRLYPGAMSIRYALGTTRNVPAVRVANIVGIKTVQDIVKQMGAGSGYNCYEPKSTKTTDCYSAAALGNGAYLKFNEEVSAYAALSNSGKAVPATMLNKVTLNGVIKSQWTQPKGAQVISTDAAYITSDILADPNASYLPNKAYFKAGDFQVSLSTGVTNTNKSASVFGYTTKYAAGLWFGAVDETKALVAGPETNAYPVISGWLTDASIGLKVTERTRPTGLQVLPAYVLTAKFMNGLVVPSTTTDLYPSYYKP